MREYFHLQKLGEENPVLKEKQVPYKGSNVLAIQTRNTAGYKYVIVPGIIVSYKERVCEGAPVSKVEPIGLEERQDVEKLLRDSGFKGPINFW